MDQLHLLERKLERERLARKQAENILESKALELYNANLSLKLLNESLEQQVKDRTQELKKSEEIAIKAQEAEKLFLANMSHEIRTPLNAIIGMSFLMAETELSKQQKEYMTIFQNSAVILKNLVADILDISKIDSGTIEVHNKSLNIHNLSTTLISTFEGEKASKNVEVTYKLDPSIKHEILADKQILNHILLNLISNAYKFTQEGKVELIIKLVKESEDFYFLSFSVTDTGIGMSNAEVKKIFNKFTQANAQIGNQYGGTGLGLTLAKRFVDVLGGNLKVESEKNKGSKFYFELKFEKSSLIEDNHTRDNHNITYSWPNKKVLIVEDNLMNQIYITTLLKKWGIEYEIANNGEEGVNQFKAKTYDLVFMDLSMPIMDGFTACKLIRESENENQRTPIIALTASTFSSKRNLALEVGMSDFLAKPFTPTQLANVLTMHFEDGQIINANSKTFSFNKQLDHQLLNLTYQDDLEYAYDMFCIFDDIIFDEIELLNKYYANKNFIELRKLAHKIKPTFSMVGLSQISQLMGEIEQSANDKLEYKIDTLMKEFQNKIQPLLALTKAEKERLKEELKR